ncbi:MAG: (2Fe-2S)-binding protein [Variibacter sp.]|nr:(2Fe-2S)-binding protein [Variibacter sp.]
MRKYPVELRINGEPHQLELPADRSLLDVLRDDLGLTGTKTNCLEAECGVCTVLIDGMAVNSCCTLAVQCAGRAITTIEGLAQGDVLHPLQQAFIEHGAVQCGYCIPGMILTAKAFLDEHAAPTEAEIREALAGTLCRCTGYQKIVDAVAAAARAMHGSARR